jgi:glutathione S-transferase
MPTIEIHGIAVSNFVRAVRMALEEKGLPYDLLSCLPHSDVPRQIHPLGKVPVMRHGAVELAETRAIVGYLEQMFPARPLFPDDPIGMARTEQWISIVNSAVDRTMIRDYVFAYFLPSTRGEEPDRAAVDTAAAAMRQQVTMLNAAVAETGYLAAGRFTYADCALLPMLAAIGNFPEGADAIATAPSLNAYLATHSQRPSFVATARGEA